MKILITGASSFIGSNLVAALLQKGHEIFVITRNEEKLRKFSWYKQVESIKLDLAHFTSSQKIPINCYQKDCLIHLAWDGIPDYGSCRHFENNVYQHYHFIKHLVQEGLSSVSVMGTCLEYGKQNGCLNEEMTIHPETPYGFAKSSLYQMLAFFQKENGFSLNWIRMFFPYGNNQRKNSIFGLLDQAIERQDTSFNMSFGDQIRDFIKIEVAVEYITSIVLQNQNYGIVNCCSGQPQSLRRVVEEYIKEKGANLNVNLGYYPYPEYEPMAFWGCTNKLQSIIKKTNL